MTMKKRWFALFTVPLFFAFIVVVIVPFVSGVYYSFVSWDGLPKNPMKFVGFANYAKAFRDARFLNSLGRTTVFTLITMLTVNVLALGFALVVTSKLRLRNVGRVMIFMPYLIGGLLLGYIWQFILGDCMATLGTMTGKSQLFFYWLSNKRFAFIGLIVVATWQMAGYMMVIYIAGLQSISDDVMEAANVDGANYWQTLVRIRLPLLMPSITICLFLTLSNCFKIYDVNLALTGGGPANSTEMVSMNIFNEIFAKSNFGYGQAKAIVFFLIVAVITMLQVRLTSSREVEV
ncbi:MAG: sugar ABC transporter permease [Clostridiales bacterium]|nr:sugar ABC transporter permease [Clostridiales bacterium]